MTRRTRRPPAGGHPIDGSAIAVQGAHGNDANSLRRVGQLTSHLEISSFRVHGLDIALGVEEYIP